MKKILVIGSTVADIIIDLVEHLPKTGEDVHVKTQRVSLGGCAFNVSDAIRHFAVPYTLFSPVGTGIYGAFIRESLAARGIVSPIPTPPEENGCCYCFVEDTGERTFISYHGAEYRFQKEWFSLLNMQEYAAVYICGLEIEEPTGPNIISFLEENPSLPIYFAPGPRLLRIAPEVLSRLYALHPILHLNETEVCQAAGEETYQAAAHTMYQKTASTVIVTLGDRGCYAFDGTKEYEIPAVPAAQVDTIGAGDSHIGAILACLQLGDPLPEAIRKANRVSAAVVGTSGALLPDEAFARLGLIQSK